MENFTLKNTKICITAKTKSGKSELLRFLLKNDPTKFHKIFCICPTERINSFYEDILEPENIFDEYDEAWLEKLIDKMSTKNGGKKPPSEKKDILIIFDDCCADANFQHSKAMNKLFTRGRHILISVIITAQYIYQINPICRSNVDYAIVGQMNSQAQELLTQEYQIRND
jgi:hypothetical protein